MFALVTFAVSNVWRRNRRRTGLTVVAVACATVVFCTVMVIPYVTERIAHAADASPRLVVINRTAMRFGLPESYYKRIVKIRDVVAVNRMVWFAGVYDDPRHQFPTVALDVTNPDVIWPEYGLDAATVAAWKAVRNGAVVGAATMHRFRWEIGQNVMLYSQLFPVTLTFTIVGSYDRGPDTTVFMFRRDYLEQALHNTGRVDMMWVRCVNSIAANRIAGEIDSMFHNSSAQTETESEKAFLVTFLIRFQSLGYLVQAVGLCAVAAIGLAVLNAFSMTLRERRNEVAVLRTLGFLNSQIMTAFAIEALTTALLGGLAGTVFAAALLNLARGAVPAMGVILSFGMPYPVFLAGIGMALLIGMAAALAPAAAALRAPIYESTRGLT